MLLPDEEIELLITRGELEVTPYDSSLLQPASLDVRLGRQLRLFSPMDEHKAIDPANPPETHLMTLGGGSVRGVETLGGDFWLEPGMFVLGSTQEWFGLPDNITARFEGKSSLGRLGLLTHITAGFIDPGFRGTITVELCNVNAAPILLRPGMRIGQMCFMKMTGPAVRPYGHPGLGSHYQGQTGVTASRV